MRHTEISEPPSEVKPFIEDVQGVLTGIGVPHQHMLHFHMKDGTYVESAPLNFGQIAHWAVTMERALNVKIRWERPAHQVLDPYMPDSFRQFHHALERYNGSAS